MEKRPFDFLIDAADVGKARHSSSTQDCKEYLEEDNFELDLQYKMPQLAAYQKPVTKPRVKLSNRRVFCKLEVTKQRKELPLQNLRGVIPIVDQLGMVLLAINHQHHVLLRLSEQLKGNSRRRFATRMSQKLRLILGRGFQKPSPSEKFHKLQSTILKNPIQSELLTQ